MRTCGYTGIGAALGTCSPYCRLARLILFIMVRALPYLVYQLPNVHFAHQIFGRTEADPSKKWRIKI
jgi:hypothetical protein